MANPPPFGTRSGRVRSAATVKTPDTKDKQEVARVDRAVFTADPPENATASVGFSCTVGQSTAYGQEKVEAWAMCTLPCAPDVEARTRAFAECVAFVTSEVKERLDEAAERFFPHVVRR